jgi:phosphoglycolate phosphatase-like HAD superfamily hydrolase
MNNKIVFDLDGTLITCENKQKYVLYSILIDKEKISPYKLDYWWELKRNGYNTEKALSEIGYSDAKSIAVKWIHNIENQLFCLLDKAFMDSVSSFKYLKAVYDFNLIILTARKSAFQVSQCIRSYGFTEYIDDLVVVNPTDVVQEKKHYLKKIKPLLYVGDSELDHSAAIHSNTRFVAVTRGQRSRAFLEKSSVDQIEDDFNFIHNYDFFRDKRKNQNKPD